jgi:diacylglycerol kinase/ribosomal protein S18 acetylase RimI-like enzyme
MIDPFTGLPLFHAFSSELACATPCAIIIDIDSLAWLNDECGFEAGDQAILAVVKATLDQLSSMPAARVFRVGGEELMALLPPDVLPAAAETIAHEVVARVRALAIPYRRTDQPARTTLEVNAAVVRIDETFAQRALGSTGLVDRYRHWFALRVNREKRRTGSVGVVVNLSAEDWTEGFELADPSPADIAFLDDQLYAFNASTTGINEGKAFGVFLRNEAKQIVAAATGHTWGETCELRQVWVAEHARGRGHGRRLLEEAEAEAARRGCLHVILTTHSFQAPDLYRKLGFEAVAELPDYPRGHSQLLFRKRLQASSSATMSKPKMTKFSPSARLRSFVYAGRGIRTMLASQHNAWIHAAATIVVVALGLVLQVSRLEWLALILAIVSVWTAEALNTAFEFLCDVASPEFHPLVEKAKDVAAGAVLICAVGAVATGALVLGPPLFELASRGAP